jgi:hypothetical protein
MGNKDREGRTPPMADKKIRAQAQLVEPRIQVHDMIG